MYCSISECCSGLVQEARLYEVRSSRVEDLLNALAAARQLLVATFLDTFAVGAYLWRPLQGLSVGVRHFVRFPCGRAWSDSGIRCVE
jgi:hypothetical protein